MQSTYLNIVCILVLNLIGSSSNVGRVVCSEGPGEDGAAVLGHHVSPCCPIIMAIKPGALRGSHIGVAPSTVHCHTPKHVEPNSRHVSDVLLLRV